MCRLKAKQIAGDLRQLWLGKSAQQDTWIADLTAAMLAASRRQDKQATAPVHRPAFKAKVTLAAVEGEKTLAELAQQYDVHLKLINKWRARRLEEGRGRVRRRARRSRSRQST